MHGSTYIKSICLEYVRRKALTASVLSASRSNRGDDAAVKTETTTVKGKVVAAGQKTPPAKTSYWSERHFYPVRAYVERSRDYSIASNSIASHVESQLPYLQWLCKIVLSKGIIRCILIYFVFRRKTCKIIWECFFDDPD